MLCETNGLPLPRLNARVCGLTVDALWEEQRVVVELDGHVAHAIAARVERDRRRELRLRAAGLTVLRYTWMQVIEQADLVVADLLAALAEGDRRRETVPVLDEADPDRGAVAGGG